MGKVYPNGWRTSKRTSRSQKYLHPKVLLMTQICNVQKTWHHGSTVFLFISPKKQNFEVCKQTKITRAPCRIRTGEAVHRAGKIGDLITADHKVLNESRHNHRCSIVVSRSRGAKLPKIEEDGKTTCLSDDENTKFPE